MARDAVETVREMKDKGSKSMRTIGSLTLCRSLLNAGLVDRFRVPAQRNVDGQVLPTPVPVGAAGWQTSQDN